MNANMFFDPITEDEISSIQEDIKSTEEEKVRIVEVKPFRPRTWMQYIDDFLMRDGSVQAAGLFSLQDGARLAVTPNFPELPAAEVVLIRDKLLSCRHVLLLKLSDDDDCSHPQLDIALASMGATYVIRYADGRRGVIAIARRSEK